MYLYTFVLIKCSAQSSPSGLHVLFSCFLQFYSEDQ